MIQVLSAPVRVTAPVIPATRPLAPTTSLPVQHTPTKDALQLQALTGSVPTSIGLFTAPTAAGTLNNALTKLASNSTQENVRDSQAGFRVAIRSLDLKGLAETEQLIKSQMKFTSDYRTQQFLHEILIDTFMEVYAKGGKPNIPEPTMPPIPGNTPDTIVAGSLKQLNCCPTEENFKTAQAGFRVAVRSLDLKGLAASEALIKAQMKTTTDYRTQQFLHEILIDNHMEIFAKGGKPNIPEPTMPPIPGNTSDTIVAGSLKQLNCCPTVENFKTAQAGFRVAIRSLDLHCLKQTEQLVKAQMKSTSDYRTQQFLDEIWIDVKLEIAAKEKA